MNADTSHDAVSMCKSRDTNLVLLSYLVELKLMMCESRRLDTDFVVNTSDVHLIYTFSWLNVNHVTLLCRTDRVSSA
jgi:hypothetical protein